MKVKGKDSIMAIKSDRLYVVGGRPTKPESITITPLVQTWPDNCVHRGKSECNKTCLEYNNCKP